MTSDLRPRLDSERQNRNFGSICHCPGWEIKEEDQDCAKRTQSRVERKVLFVSRNLSFGLKLLRISFLNYKNFVMLTRFSFDIFEYYGSSMFF